jgi:hypothetical protein
MMVQRSILFATLALAAGWAGASCNDRVAEVGSCYPPETYRDPAAVGGDPRDAEGFCSWKLGEIPTDYVPEGQDGNNYDLCFELAAGETCDACPADETDQRIKDAFEAECGEEVLGFVRGCASPRDDGICCYRALVSPLCRANH